MTRTHLRLFFAFIIFTISVLQAGPADWGEIQSSRKAVVHFSEAIDSTFLNHLAIDPQNSILSYSMHSDSLYINVVRPFALDRHYYLVINDTMRIFLVPAGILDSLHSNKPLGYHIENGQNTFRVFAPRASWVKLILYSNYKSSEGREYRMKRDADGVWEYSSPDNLTGKFYGYKIWGPQGEGEMFDSTIVVADPYSRSVVTQNYFTHPAKTLITPDPAFNWEGDRYAGTAWRDLIIYEAHMRDMTADKSSGLPADLRGTYPGLIQEKQNGGLPYLKSLGVNAVEWLPIQDFGNIELPYRNPTTPLYNTWNPYARNHWGYMTSYFFAPESYYGRDGTMEKGAYNGADGSQVNQFKETVKALHKNGMAVLMDVVYNHVSEYDLNPLKYIDKFYYFRLNRDCSFTSVSGCGNDLKTERPMARRLIIDSVVHWIKDYHIDGFRFDLASLIDWQTCNEILKKAQAINPAAVIIAEPWGGSYNPSGFSDHGWAAWNDQIRNGVKGQNPFDGLGFIFGKWQGDNNRESLKRYVLGSLRQYGGQYLRVKHSVNYLASHDDHTLGDFIRLGLGAVHESDRITDLKKNAALTPLQYKLNALGALFLFTSQGPIMMQEGQEYARSKVIEKTAVADTNWGRIDHNSYNKDNKTNWLNFDFAKANSQLVNYYRGLIQMRKAHPAFRHATPQQIKFFDQPDPFFLVYTINYQNTEYLVLLNGNRTSDNQFVSENNEWLVLADGSQASDKPVGVLKSADIRIPPGSGMVLMRPLKNQ